MLGKPVYAQETSIKGFVAAGINYKAEGDNLSFGYGEQDLFITSELSDRFSFLGETVFKYKNEFKVSVERIIIKYNYKGNHNILIGRHHTPLNYWNDTYHHGRLFFPTISRPEIFSAKIIPIHTTGISFQGYNLTKIKFGYDIMIGNGIGSPEITDNDDNKSISIGLHSKPIGGLRIGASGYFDKISAGAKIPGGEAAEDIVQQIFSGSVAYFNFESPYEFLAEVSHATNATDSLGSKQASAFYIYAGYKIGKLVPYMRYDNIFYQNSEMFYKKNNVEMVVIGLRYEYNYLTVIKLEYQYDEKESSGFSNSINLQVAVGF